jgi:hypothetical protein
VQAGLNQLQAVVQKLCAQVIPEAPELGAALIGAVEQLVGTLSRAGD